MPAALPPDYNFALASDTSTSPELEFLHLRPNQRNVGDARLIQCALRLSF
jgi:hypothetical protein